MEETNERLKKKSRDIISDMDKSKKSTVRLIAGTPRSATTWLARALNTHPYVAAFGETSFWGKKYHSPDQRGIYTIDSLREVITDLKAYELPVTINSNKNGSLKNVTLEKISGIVEKTFSNKMGPLSPGEVFCRFGEAVAQAEGKQYWVEKTPHHVMWAERIFNALPNARLVVLLREPYSFLRSYKSKMETNFERGERSDIYHPLRGAIVWRSTARATIKLIDKYPEKVLLLKTHDLHKNPIPILNRVLSFFELPAIDWDKITLPSSSTNTFFSNNIKPELPEVDRAWMNIVAHKEIVEANFNIIPSKAKKILFIKSLLVLPKWIIQTYRNIDNYTPGSTMRYLRRWISAGRKTET